VIVAKQVISFGSVGDKIQRYSTLGFGKEVIRMMFSFLEEGEVELLG